MSERIVIVGAGVAGATAARTLRTEGYTGEIVLLGAESGLPYRRPMVSKELLAGTATESRMLLQTADFWHAHAVDIRTATAVASVDVAGARVRLTDGSELGYDSLLLATGARPRALPRQSDGVAADGRSVLHTLRGSADTDALRFAITGRTSGRYVSAGPGDAPPDAPVADKSLLIVGAGLIGCEVAATARALGARVTMLDAARRPLDRVAPAVVGEFYRDMHARNGVELHSEVLLADLAPVDAFRHTPAGVLATAVDGRTWTADAALVAIGSVPDTALAVAAGLDVSDGIRVDERFRTSAPGVFAAGDVAARFDPELGGHRREEHWNSAQAQGAAVARSMLGLAPGPLEIPWGWSMQYGVNLQFAGRIAPEDELLLRGSVAEGKFMVLAARSDRVVGAVAVGCPADFRAARESITAGLAPDAADIPLGQLTS
ncbi:NAD(P)/FAD-dependent oxidoreductase [Nocardia yamanashiensis]|uniref:NAD(P)/FAD-dependent oxidoreductase n=1 Tax=Nocardia yamanashiensis TaxID=209247 RepID=UPI0008361E1E|nr:FAD-dependent oxidoreductase [Nocardia yamanashiensis]